MAPIRGMRAHRPMISEADVIPYLHEHAPHIAKYYETYSSELHPLSDVSAVPDDLVAVPRPNGDILLCASDGEEVLFDVIGAVVELCLEVPSAFAKSKFPFFCRWIKICAPGDRSFDAAIRASNVLYNFMKLHANNTLPPPVFFTGGLQCFRPSCVMLTCADTVPGVTAVDIPPLDNPARIEAAVRASHGKYIFSADNEVLYFADEQTPNCDISRREVAPSSIRVGQIVQIKMGFRLLKQENGTFTFREMLKGVYVLHTGFSMQLSRKVASQATNTTPKRNRDARVYNLPGSTSRGGSCPSFFNAQNIV